MTGILFIGVVTALAGFAILAKACAGKRKRAEKSEKAEIIRQLLVLSERENSISATPRVQFRGSLSDQGMRPGKFQQKRLGRRPG